MPNLKSETSAVGRYFPPATDLSLADEVASLPAEQRERLMRDVDPRQLLYDYHFWARKSQLAALESPATYVVALAGRGWGKTWTMSKWVHKKAMDNPGCRISLVGRVVSDVRDVMIMGESGILNVSPPYEQPRYVSTARRVVWPNGSEAITYSADIASQLRGPQSHYTACDELATWRQKPDSSQMNMWGNVRMSTRLGDNPQIFVATTPRRVPDILDLYSLAQSDPGVVDVIRGSTFANRHLARTYIDVVTGLYGGTALGAQELEGELVSDIDGALLVEKVIDDSRDLDAPDPLSLPLRAIGVDPSVSERPNDECGIVAVCSTGERELHRRHAWVYEDLTILGSPQKWARVVAQAARRYQAVVVAEDNQGGEMVRMVIKNEAPEVPVVKVRAMAGKALRAEPVVLAYEQGRVHHADYLGQLESQLTTWVPGESLRSPDRLDAEVHALAALLVKTPARWAGEIRVTAGAARSSLPGVRHTSPAQESASPAEVALLGRRPPRRAASPARYRLNGVK